MLECWIFYFYDKYIFLSYFYNVTHQLVSYFKTGNERPIAVVKVDPRFMCSNKNGWNRTLDDDAVLSLSSEASKTARQF